MSIGQNLSYTGVEVSAMDLNALNSALTMVIGVLALVAAANLVDFGLRLTSEHKAERAERARFLRWGLPAAPVHPEKRDEHLWHF